MFREGLSRLEGTSVVGTQRVGEKCGPGAAFHFEKRLPLKGNTIERSIQNLAVNKGNSFSLHSHTFFFTFLTEIIDF